MNDPTYYPPAERAGFNFGKALLAMLKNLGIDELDFIRGIVKPLDKRVAEITEEAKE